MRDQTFITLSDMVKGLSSEGLLKIVCVINHTGDGTRKLCRTFIHLDELRETKNERSFDVSISKEFVFVSCLFAKTRSSARWKLFLRKLVMQKWELLQMFLRQRAL